MILLQIAFLLLIIGPFIWLAISHEFGTSKHGKLHIGDHDYPCELGDNLQRISGQSFSGLAIVLPKELPQIFLDSLANDKIKGQDFLFAPGQKLSLEGDFDKHFQVFVPKKAQSLTLSILTPDVMQTLIAYGTRFDIEIINDHLYITAPTKLFLKRSQEKQLLKIADKLLKEIDHKLASWHEPIDKTGLYLEVLEHRAVKVGSHYFSWWGFWFAAFLIMVAVVFWYWGLAMVLGGSARDQNLGWIIFGAGCFFFPGVYLLVRIFLHHRP